LAAVGESAFDVSARLSTPVWASAGGVARRWQDDALIGEAFWSALDGAADAAPVDATEPPVVRPVKTAKAEKPTKGKRKKPIRSRYVPVGNAHQTVTEQVKTFLATGEPVDLDVVGAEVVAGRACDVVRATVRHSEGGRDDRHAMGGGAVELRLWVDAERLVIVRAVKLRDGEPTEIVEFLDVAFDD
jgi:hypothetical protein